MDDEMAVDAYLSTTEPKTQTMQTRRTETESRVREPRDGRQMGGD